MIPSLAFSLATQAHLACFAPPTLLVWLPELHERHKELVLRTLLTRLAASFYGGTCQVFGSEPLGSSNPPLPSSARQIRPLQAVEVAPDPAFPKL